MPWTLPRGNASTRAPVASEMRPLRAGRQGRLVGTRIDDGAGPPHARMRLERPLVFRFDDPRGTRETRVDLASLDRHLPFEDAHLTDRVVGSK